MPSPNSRTRNYRRPLGEQKHEVMPTLFGDGYGLYEVRKGSFVVSFMLNTAIIALLIWLGSWTASHAPQIKQVVGVAGYQPLRLPAPRTVSGGGGGGGSHDMMPASKGALPKFAKTQLAPPTVLPMEQPKLAVAPTVVVLQRLKCRSLGRWATRWQRSAAPLSNGTGVGGGIGSGQRRRSGSGRGPGVGPGWGGGMGGGAYHVGGGVSAPEDSLSGRP